MDLCLALLLSTAAALWATGTAAEPTTLDRAALKQPKYHYQPMYFALDLGPEAKRRVRCVLDRRILYIDRNGNGDLTEPSKRIVAGPVRDDFEIGDLPGSDGKIMLRNVRAFLEMQGADGPPRSMQLRVSVKGEYEMYTFLPIDHAMDRPGEAPSVYFGGELRLGLWGGEKARLVRGREPEHLAVYIGTFDPGGKLSATVLESSVPKEVHPIAEIAFPGKAPGSHLPVVKVPLLGRC